MRTVLIDGDVLVYESSFGAQRNRYIVYVNGGDTRHFQNARERDAFLKEAKLEPEQYSVEKVLDVLEEPAALAICKNKLTALVEALAADSYTIYLTGKGNFRDEVATLAPYKGNRAHVEKPVHFQACRDWFVNHSQAVVVNGEEADDAIGIRQTELGNKGIVASIDKDLRQIPGPHYEWHKQAKFAVSPDDADRWFWMQMLMGDSADNIPGIPKIGPVKAEKLLSGMGTRQHRADQVALQYVRHYGDSWREWMQEVGRLLWIRRQPGELWDYAAYAEGRM